jgi:hypothetical protein
MMTYFTCIIKDPEDEKNRSSIVRQELAHQVQTRSCLQILELASQYSLPMETLFAESISLIGDSKNGLVSESYRQALKSEVILPPFKG